MRTIATAAEPAEPPESPSSAPAPPRPILFQVPRNCITCDGPSCTVIAPKKRCTACKVAFYCSQKCQKRHYKDTHKTCCHNSQLRWEHVFNTFPPLQPVNNNFECGICLEEDKQKIVVVPECRHGFCLRCLFDWNKAKGDAWIRDKTVQDRELTCPLCRSTVIEGTRQYPVFRSRYLGKQATKAKNIDEQEALVQEAFFELGKLLAADDESTRLDALLAKADVLRMVKRSDEALEVLNEVKEMLKVTDKTSQRIAYLTTEHRKAKLANDQARLHELAVEMLALFNSKLALLTIEEHKSHLLDYNIILAGVHANKGEYAQAIKLYENPVTEMSSDYQAQESALGYLDCLYQANLLLKIVKSAKIFLEGNRKIGCTYKYLALAQRDMGLLGAAKVTLNQGLLYAVCEEDMRMEMYEMYKAISKRLEG